LIEARCLNNKFSVNACPQKHSEAIRNQEQKRPEINQHSFTQRVVPRLQQHRTGSLRTRQRNIGFMANFPTGKRGSLHAFPAIPKSIAQV